MDLKIWLRLLIQCARIWWPSAYRLTAIPVNRHPQKFRYSECVQFPNFFVGDIPESSRIQFAAPTPIT